MWYCKSWGAGPSPTKQEGRGPTHVGLGRSFARGSRRLVGGSEVDEAEGVEISVEGDLCMYSRSLCGLQDNG